MKKNKLKEFVVECKISGRAVSYVMAENEEDVMENFYNLDIKDEDLIEWNFEEIEHIEENK